MEQISQNKKAVANIKSQRRIRPMKLILLCLCCGILIYCGRNLAEDHRRQNQENINTQASGMTFANTLLDREVEEKLLSLAQDNPDIAKIYLDRASYPEELLKALTLNHEMLDFVKGWPDSDGSVTGGLTSDEAAQKYPLLLQWDSRWGYYPYGESNIGIAGCGPTCLSMVIISLTGNGDATPDKLADYSMKNGHYVSGAGTAWSLMTKAPASYGVTAGELSLDEAVMKRHLDQNGMIICAMRPGDFTTSGHFIVIYSYDEDGFQVNDPNSRERSGKTWPYSTIKSQIKNLWGFSMP